MKIVINTDYGMISEETAAQRTDPKFIEDVETGRFVGHVFEGSWGGYAETLKVVEVPDDATDLRIVNYDGCEGVIYVLNGKIFYTGTEECRSIFEF